MANKKPTKATKSSAKSALGKAINKSDNAGLEVARSVVPDEAPTRPLGGISTVEIGHVAGDVWSVLDRNGGLTLAALKKEVAAPVDVVLAAVGWLAREDKLEFSTAGRTVKISLR
jgi:hypothetical protein